MPEPTGSDAADATPCYRVGDLRVDVGCAQVWRGDDEIPLPRLSFDLLRVLIDQAPRIVSIDDLMDRVWAGVVVSPETVSQRVKLLRDALGDDPREPRYVAGVRGRGYRLVAAVERIPEPAAIPAPSGATAWRRVPVMAAVIGLLILGAAALLWSQRATNGAGSDRGSDAEPRGGLAPVTDRSVAVLPFESHGGEASTEVLALGIAEAVLHQLANLDEITVIARTSSFAFRGRGGDVRRIGRELRARYLLEGSVQQQGGRLRVNAQLVDANTAAQVWSLKFDETLEDVFKVQDEIALEVARALRLSLDAGEADRLAGQGTRSFDAYLAYLQGRALLATRRLADVARAAEHFESAVTLDPGFAQAWVAAAEAELYRAEYEMSDQRQERFAAARGRAENWLRHALTLDAGLGAAYRELGNVQASTDLAAAEASYRRGMELAPNDARGCAALAAVLFEDPARRAEAVDLLDRARRLDPLEPAHDVTKAVFLLYERGDVDGAEALLRDVLQRHPLYLPAITRLGELTWCCRGRSAEAIQLLEQAIELDPRAHWQRRLLVRAYLDIGDPQAAESVVAESATGRGVLELPGLVFRRDWRRAGDVAYAALDAGIVTPVDELVAVTAIRHHARVTKQYARATDALQATAGIEWDGQGTPVLPNRRDLMVSAIGLADLLLASGQVERGRRIVRAVLERMQTDLADGTRGETWYHQRRPIALALSGDLDGALDALHRGVEARLLVANAWLIMDVDPALDPLRGDPRFQALLESTRRATAEQRARLEDLRAKGLVPPRRISPPGSS